MLELFNNLDPVVQAAVITAFGGIIVACLGLVKKSKASKKNNIKQKQKGSDNTQIGIQNNYGERVDKNE